MKLVLRSKVEKLCSLCCAVCNPPKILCMIFYVSPGMVFVFVFVKCSLQTPKPSIHPYPSALRKWKGIMKIRLKWR